MINKYEGKSSNQNQSELDSSISKSKGLKFTMFKFFYSLVNTVNFSVFFVAIVNFIELGQTISYSLSIFENYQNDNKIFYYVNVVFSFLRIVTWVKLIGNFSVFLGFMYACLGILLLTLFFSIIYSRSLFSSIESLKWLKPILQKVLYCFTNFLIIPFADLFVTIFNCKSDGNAFSMVLFSSQTCFQGIYILYMISAIIGFLFLAFITLLSSFLFYDPRSFYGTIISSPGSNKRLHLSIINLILSIILGISIFSNSYVQIVFLLLYLSHDYQIIKIEKFFYNDTISFIHVICCAIRIGTVISVAVCIIASQADYSAAIILFFISIPILILTAYLKYKEVDVRELINLYRHQSGEGIVSGLSIFYSMLSQRENNRETAMLFYGFSNIHNDNCIFDDCPLNNTVAYWKNAVKIKKDKPNYRRKKEKENPLLIQFILRQFQRNIQAFPKCNLVRIAFSCFLCYNMKNNNLALSEIKYAKLYVNSMNEEFAIYFMESILEERLLGFGDHDSESEGSMDTAALIAFENSFTQLRKNIEISARSHHKFWSILTNESPIILDVRKEGRVVMDNINLVEITWNRMQQIYPNVQKSLRLYSSYNLFILNDQEASEELQEKANVALNLKTSQIQCSSAQEYLDQLVDDKACISINCEGAKKEEITGYNLSACKIFGYPKNELNGLSISLLMSPCIASIHSKLIEKIATSNLKVNTYHPEMFILGRQKCGYLIPLKKSLKVFVKPNEGVELLAMFQEIKDSLRSKTCFILLNKNREVEGISTRAIEMIGINNKIIEKGHLQISEILPSLFLPEIYEKCKSKNGFYVEIITSNSIIISKNSGSDPIGRFKQILCHIQEICPQGNVIVGYIIRLEIACGEGNAIEVSPKEEAEDSNVCCFQIEPQSASYIKNFLRKDKVTENFELKPGIAIEEEKDDHENLENNEGTSQRKCKILEISKINEIYTLKNQAKTKTKSMASSQDVEHSDKSPKDVEAQEEKESESSKGKDLITKKNYGEAIKTYRFYNGSFIEVNSVSGFDKLKNPNEIIIAEDEVKKPKARGQKDEEELTNQNLSRKRLAEKIDQEKSSILATIIRNIFHLILILILAFSIADFAFSQIKFTYLSNTISSIEKSEERNLAVLNSGTYSQLMSYYHYFFEKFKNTNTNSDKWLIFNFTSEPNSICNNHMKENIDSIYLNQNFLDTQQIFIYDQQTILNENKVVTFSYSNSNGQSSNTQYTLPEAVQQIISSIFDIANVNNNNELFDINNNTMVNIFQLNAYSYLYYKVRNSTQYYLDDLIKGNNSYIQSIQILFYIIEILLILSVFFMFPLVAFFARQEYFILYHFLDIPKSTIKVLIKKCEQFIGSGEENDGDENLSESLLDFDASLNIIDDSSIGLRFDQKDNFKHNELKKNVKGNLKFYLAYLFFILITCGYFVFSYTLQQIFVYSTEASGKEMLTLAVTTPSFYIIYNQIIHLLINGTIQNFYQNNNNIPSDYPSLIENSMKTIISSMRVTNDDYLDSEYSTTYFNILYSDLCPLLESNKNITFTCKWFMESMTSQGLMSILARFTENIREIYNFYIANKGTDTNKTYINEKLFWEETKSILEIFPITYKSLRNTLNTRYNSMISFRSVLKTAFFIIILAFCLIAYLGFWLPFIGSLAQNVTKSKMMMLIIPTTIFVRMQKLLKLLGIK